MAGRYKEDVNVPQKRNNIILCIIQPKFYNKSITTADYNKIVPEDFALYNFQKRF